MFCPNCGSNNPDGVAFCANCGSQLDNQQPQQAVPQPEFQQPQQQPQQQYQQPEFQQPYQQPQQQYQPPYMPPMPVTAPVPGKALGIAGMVLGIVSLVLCCLLWYLTLILSIPGLILSCIGLSKAKKENVPNGMAVAGIVCSAINIGVNIIFIVLVALSVASLGFYY